MLNQVSFYNLKYKAKYFSMHAYYFYILPTPYSIKEFIPVFITYFSIKLRDNFTNTGKVKDENLVTLYFHQVHHLLMWPELTLHLYPAFILQ